MTSFMICAVPSPICSPSTFDPYLPAELLPADWPGEGLRERYAEFSASYAQRLRDYSGG